MKKALSFLVLAIFVVTTAHAGYNANTRSKCRWWAKRFAANGHISAWCGIGYNYSSSHSGDCDFAQIHFTRSFCNCPASATVHSENGWGGAYGYFYGACNMNGGTLSDLYLELNDGGGGNGGGFDPATIESKSMSSITPRTVDISGISLAMSSDVADPFLNTFTVGVWIPQEDSLNGVEDTVYASSKAIVEGVVTLQNGKISVTGDLFTPRDFQVTGNGSRVNVSYVGGAKSIRVPAGMNSDDLAVAMIGDVIDNQKHKFSQSVAQNNGVLAGSLDFRAYPNPAASQLSFSIQSPEAAVVSISVYNAEGRLVQRRPDVQVAAGTTETSMNISALAAGQYFVLIEGSGIKVIRQISKQ